MILPCGWIFFQTLDKQYVMQSQVKAVGGLLVLVLSMQESERVANQLKGRAGRQGDPGETFTHVDLNDPLVESSGLTSGLDVIGPMLQSVFEQLSTLIPGCMSASVAGRVGQPVSHAQLCMPWDTGVLSRLQQDLLDRLTRTCSQRLDCERHLVTLLRRSC